MRTNGRTHVPTTGTPSAKKTACGVAAGTTARRSIWLVLCPRTNKPGPCRARQPTELAFVAVRCELKRFVQRQSGLEQSTPACTACQDQNCRLSASAAAGRPAPGRALRPRSAPTPAALRSARSRSQTCGGIVPTPASCKDDLYAVCCAQVTACAESDECAALIYLCIDDQGCNPGQACWD